MKNALTLLSIGVVLLLGLLFLTHSQANTRLAQARQESLTLSNEILQLKVKLTQHTKAQLDLLDTCSNQVANLTALSNQLAHATVRADQAQAQAAAAMAQRQAAEEKVQALLQERSRLAQTNAELAATLQRTVADRDAALAQAGQLEQQRADLQQALNCAQAQLAEARRQLNDPDTLQLRLRQWKATLADRRSPRPPSPGADEQSQSDPGSGATHSASLKSKHPKLQLLSDGTVRIAPVMPEPAQRQ